MTPVPEDDPAPTLRETVERLPLGARVVLRWALPEPADLPGSPSLTDTVGELLFRDEATLRVAARRGEVEVRRDAVVAAKVVPPRPGRRGAPHRAVTIDDLQRLMTAGNPPVERAWLGEERRGWLLRAGGGFTGRANSLLPVGDPGMPLDAAVDAAHEWYRARGQQLLVMLALPAGGRPEDDPLGRLLLDRGLTPRPRVHVMTARTAEVLAGATDERTPDVAVLRESSLTEAWLSAADPRAATAPEAARAVIGGPEDQTFLSAVPADGDADPFARERLAVTRVPCHDGWAGIFGLRVREDHRRRGLGRLLTAAAALEAQRRTVVSMYLQVEADNSPGVALYRSLGFGVHHDYVYLAAD